MIDAGNEDCAEQALPPQPRASFPPRPGRWSASMLSSSFQCSWFPRIAGDKFDHLWDKDQGFGLCGGITVVAGLREVDRDREAASVNRPAPTAAFIGEPPR